MHADSMVPRSRKSAAKRGSKGDISFWVPTHGDFSLEVYRIVTCKWKLRAECLPLGVKEFASNFAVIWSKVKNLSLSPAPWTEGFDL